LEQSLKERHLLSQVPKKIPLNDAPFDNKMWDNGGDLVLGKRDRNDLDEQIEGDEGPNKRERIE